MNPLTTSNPPDVAWPALAAVAVLVAAAVLLQWWLRGRGLLPAQANPIRVVALRSLGGKKSVAVVEVESQRFLLGLGDDSVSLLGQLPSETKASTGGTVVALPVGVAR